MRAWRGGFFGEVEFQSQPVRCWFEPVEDGLFEAYTPVGICLGVFEFDEIRTKDAGRENIKAD